MRIGTIVSGNTYRHPAVLAKMATGIDLMSGGRLICGIGGAWQENEHQAYGMPVLHGGGASGASRRGVRGAQATLDGKKVDWKGKYYTLEDAPLEPKPVQRPYPELMIGGGGEKVTLKIAARHADHWNVWGGPATLAAKGKILDGHCATLGRDPKKILRSAVMVLAMSDDAAEVEKLKKAYMARMGADEEKARDTVLGGSVAQIQDKLGRLREAGVGMLFIPSFFLPADKKKALDRFITEVAPALALARHAARSGRRSPPAARSTRAGCGARGRSARAGRPGARAGR